MADAKLARRVSMFSPTNLTFSSVGGTTVGYGEYDTHDCSDGEGDLDLLQDEDGKSNGSGKDDDVKSGGGDHNDGIFDGCNGWQVDGDAALHRSMVAL
nr:hypothetical protein [Tanacetum cinerariifolium]GFA06671.1 hypothetical protein [Tanacetum cinerariifolium]